MTRWLAIADRWLGPSVADRWQARAGLTLAMCIAVTLVAFAPAFAAIGLRDVALACVATGMAFGVLGRVWGSLDHTVAVHLLLLLCYTLETVAVVLHGGPSSPFLALLPIPALYATMLSGNRVGAVWLAIGITYVFAINLLGETATLGPPPKPSLFWLVVMPPMLFFTTGVVGAVRRLRDAARAEVHTARRRAEAADAAKGELLAMVSHEMRTPLTGILGAAELLSLQASDSERVVRQAGLILRSGGQLTTLVDDLLALDQLERQSVSLRDGYFSPVEVLRDTASVARQGHAGATVELTLADDLPDMVRGDPDRFAQILGNLVQNALRYGARTVTVEARGALTVVVQDDGPGVDPADADRIFEPFERGRRASPGGSGLGLAISRRLAQAMGGTLVLTPSGQGARFELKVEMPSATPR